MFSYTVCVCLHSEQWVSNSQRWFFSATASWGGCSLGPAGHCSEYSIYLISLEYIIEQQFVDHQTSCFTVCTMHLTYSCLNFANEWADLGDTGFTELWHQCNEILNLWGTFHSPQHSPPKKRSFNGGKWKNARKSKRGGIVLLQQV